MPQQTNLNVSPYFDDFDPLNDYHKVLFKPGAPIQARELTTLQSILQDQIEKFGQHFFKEGSKVISGNIGYNQLYYCVELINSYKGVPIESYIDQIIGTKITGQTSGISAYIDYVLYSDNSERGNVTLYMNYLGSSTSNNSSQTFIDGESLLCSTSISSGLLGNTIISAGSPFANIIPNNATSIGSSFQIENGVYFIKGRFITVEKEILLLEQYSNTPNYRVGLFVNEEIVTSNIDDSLNDNAQGYNNYSAPGADRFKIRVSLQKKELDDLDDNNFVELATIEDGILQSNINSSNLRASNASLITDIISKKIHQNTGDYVVSPFSISLLNSLNDNLGNRGIFSADEFTPTGGTPSDSLAVYKISPGKAIVGGKEVEIISPTFIDVSKPRDIKSVSNQSIEYNTGNTFKLNTVYKSPELGLGNTYYVSLRDSRVGSNPEVASGTEIGLARVYDFKLNSKSYDSTDPDSNEWGVSLYDIDTYDFITLNQNITLTTPTFIKGENSGATAFLRSDVSNNNSITVYGKSGNFSENENITFNGLFDNNRTIVSINSNGISNAKSLYGTVGSNIFSANIIQSTNYTITECSISTGGNITNSNSRLPGTIKVGDLINYSDSDPSRNGTVINRVITINSDSIEVEAVTNITNVVDGNLPSSNIDSADLNILTTKLETSSDNTLYTKLPKKNIYDVDLTDASITIRKSFIVDISSNKISSSTLPTSGTNEEFMPFTPIRYSLIRSDGVTEDLSADKFTFSGNTCEIENLGSDDTGAILTTTLVKTNLVEKNKKINDANYIIIDKSNNASSGVGATTLDDGLDYGSGNYPFGTRVQDNIISLNLPDIVEIHGIFESKDENDPSAPQVTLSELKTVSGTTSEISVGETILGNSSNAIGIVVGIISDTTIAFVYKNNIQFRQNEEIFFATSLVTGICQSITSPSFQISSHYTFNDGQEDTLYNYGCIKRKNNFKSPTKKIIIYFSNGFYESTDTGDITTSNSYDSFNYTNEIKDISGNKFSDIIDIRPRVSDYSVVEGNRSPLEFLGRSFNQSGNSAPNILASGESITLSFSYYVGRIDRIFLSKEGNFQVKYGISSDNPENPVGIDGCLEIANVYLPPYLYNTNDVSITFLDKKRYQMSDIKKLEDRIKKLEYYTSLSLLETNISNKFIPDNDGFNRVKSGFFVDNFNSFKSQDNSIGYNNSIDRYNKELRPKHYTNSIDLINGPVVNVDPNQDLSSVSIEGTDVRKQNDIITLQYSEVDYISQSFATKSENVSPFLTTFWQATLELNPASDNWIDTTKIESRVSNNDSNYSEMLSYISNNLNVDPQEGFASNLWDSWSNYWIGKNISSGNNKRINNLFEITPISSTKTINEKYSSNNTYNDVNDKSRTLLFDDSEKISIGGKSVSRDIIANMRSRNIQFISKRLKPNTRLYTFFDGIDVTKYCIPKLLEITMIDGIFEVGETVEGRISKVGLDEDFYDTTNPKITFRVCNKNHKEGPYNSPTSIFSKDPYKDDVNLSSDYTSNSDILNVDIFSLSNKVQGSYSGWIEPGMVLVGSRSNARARIKNLRLVSDLSSTLIGSFYIPDPNNINNPKFESGTKVFRITSDPNNDMGDITTIAEEEYISSGIIGIVDDNTISVRKNRLENTHQFNSLIASSGSNTQIVPGKSIKNSSITHSDINAWYNPLSQSFSVMDDTGIFLTRCDIFFRSKDNVNVPIVLQLRTMENGIPSQKVLPFSEIVLNPNQIKISPDATEATSFTFKAPIYLEGNGREYCICLSSNSNRYSVFVSKIGNVDTITGDTVSNQRYSGNLFKSQNAFAWESSQSEDLKFSLYRANFVSSGSVDFYNPELSEGNNQITNLLPDSLNINSRKIRIGLASTVGDPNYNIGNIFSQVGTNATGRLVGTAAAITGTSITDSGIGYENSTTLTGIPFNSITGNGRGSTGDITINSSGEVTGLSNVTGGSGYLVGDVLGISTTPGSGAKVTVTGIGVTSELILDNVQGDFNSVGTANSITYTNSVGISSYLDEPNGGNIQVSTIIVENDGLTINIDHKNHGMYFDDNLVRIYGVQSDIKPTKLISEYRVGSTGNISVEDSSIFGNFENVGIGTTNVGLIRIDDEIIEYTSVSGNNLGGNIVRGINPKDYPIGTPVYKYELAGVSLARINAVHDLSLVTNNNISFDSYDIKINTSTKYNTNNTDRSDSTSYPALYLNETKSTGGYNIKASQNIPFEIITPLVQNLTVFGTTISANIQSVTSQSLSGSETPYTKTNFEVVSLNETNYLDSPRLVCSKVNEDSQLSSLALSGNKSLNMQLSLNTIDSRVSPVIDAQRVSLILTSNRIDNEIVNYDLDNRVNNIDTDITPFQYISKEFSLENSASGVKVILNAHINDFNDIKVFYYTNSSPNNNPIFKLFEDSNNITKAPTRGFDSNELEFSEYSFSIDNLDAFRYYRIKIIMTSNSQVYVPRIKDLRVIALA